MKTTHDILSYFITFSSFLIPILQLLFNRDNRIWYKKITTLGWFAFAFGILCVTDAGMSRAIKKEDTKDSDSIAKYRDGKIAKLQYSLDSSKLATHRIDSILVNVYNLQLTSNGSGEIKIVTNNYSQSGTTTCPISIVIMRKPTNRMQTLCNGEKIPLQYKLQGKFIFRVPYMAGKEYAGNFVLGGGVIPVKYDKATGTFDMSQYMGDELPDSISVTFTANIPLKENAPTFKMIEIKGKPINKDGTFTSFSDDFFSEPVTQITVFSQSYLLGVDYTQNEAKRTVTFTNGSTFMNRGDKARASR